MEHFSKGTEKKRRREAGKGGAREKMGERKRERVQGGGEMKGYYFFLYLSFPCYLPYDFLIHQNAGKIMFWAK